MSSFLSNLSETYFRLGPDLLNKSRNKYRHPFLQSSIIEGFQGDFKACLNYPEKNIPENSDFENYLQSIEHTLPRENTRISKRQKKKLFNSRLLGFDSRIMGGQGPFDLSNNFGYWSNFFSPKDFRNNNNDSGLIIPIACIHTGGIYQNYMSRYSLTEQVNTLLKKYYPGLKYRIHIFDYDLTTFYVHDILKELRKLRPKLVIGIFLVQDLGLNHIPEQFGLDEIGFDQVLLVSNHIPYIKPIQNTTLSWTKAFDIQYSYSDIGLEEDPFTTVLTRSSLRRYLLKRPNIGFMIHPGISRNKLVNILVNDLIQGKLKKVVKKIINPMTTVYWLNKSTNMTMDVMFNIMIHDLVTYTIEGMPRTLQVNTKFIEHHHLDFLRFLHWNNMKKLSKYQNYIKNLIQVGQSLYNKTPISRYCSCLNCRDLSILDDFQDTQNE